ncbi:hypothetical protein CUMW_265610 [Citrus unshiu]|uniref:Uncharacterized protein n=1 Tax=Citrus unshiu TaxID=55188 RepID=A0A2H5QVI1_CITUN|nr:hypothetical protein CUMW_265610 [Citrus unshiu]
MFKGGVVYDVLRLGASTPHVVKFVPRTKGGSVSPRHASGAGMIPKGWWCSWSRPTSWWSSWSSSCCSCLKAFCCQCFWSFEAFEIFMWWYQICGSV